MKSITLFKTLLSLSFVTVSSLSGGVVHAQSNLDAFVDSNIVGKERSIVTSVLQDIPESQRGDLIVIASDGQIYTNKPELKKEVIEYTKNKEGVFEDSDGNKIFPPKQDRPEQIQLQSPLNSFSTEVKVDEKGQQSSNTLAIEGNAELIQPLVSQVPATGGSGPYRRVESYNSYSWASANIYLTNDVSDNDSTAPYYDTGYLYMGGWGEASNAVDAGFKHNSLDNTYSPMMQIDGTPYGFTPRVASGQTAYLETYVGTNGNFIMHAEYKDTTGVSRSINVSVYAPGFKQNGANIMKRMTTMGQKTEYLTTKTYLRGAVWSNARIGASTSSYHVWADSDTWQFQSYGNRIGLNKTNASNETVSILPGS
ncbi:hypothetical protein [Paenibacillus monticola]|uniref:Uncharacterized protein n=1 Tax=Paenibacillus monticola TaxID=2666075 RepID=A0A7X2L1F2_9BACL|nr:hypothetical protein [Paenibacillus monticola]MRN53108.1 hypothetical protein [Paenibacillus monticola]